MNEDRFKQFSEVYRTCLREAVEAHPDRYMTPRSMTPAEGAAFLADKILAAVHDHPHMVNYRSGEAFKRACKALGIPHTVKAIMAYLEGTA